MIDILKALFWTVIIIAVIGAVFVVGAVLAPVAIVGIIFFFVLLILKDLQDEE